MNRLVTLEQTDFYRLLVSSIQDYAIFLLDPKGIISTWNLGAQKLKGYEPEEIIGKHFSIFYPKVDQENGKPAKLLTVSKKEGHVEDEGWRVKKDGSRFWANVTITALKDKSGELIGFAKVTRDLTERKRHEDAMALANEQLEQQRRELELLNQAKDEFISLASHQLRTPASGVKQFLGLLREGYAGDLSDLQKEFIERAYEGNARQLELVNDLLRVAQVDAGRITLNTTTEDLTGIIKDVIAEQQSSFEKRRQTVSLHGLNHPLKAKVDKARIRMVLENIVSNASKYTPEGGDITITGSKKNRAIEIAIKDTGVGIPKAAQSKLFNKFSRIPNELSDVVGGSGLGLYWAHKIMELHGGRIEVASKLHKGSVFTVVVPLKDWRE
jgi:hypothetical protein